MKLAGFTITRDKKQRSEQSLQNEVEIALKRIATEEPSASQQEKEPSKWLPALRFGAPSVANRRNYNRHELIAEYKAPLCASIKETYRRSINDESFTDRRISTAAEEIICDEFRSAKFDVCFQRKLLSILSISVFFSVGLTTTLFTS
ncbi:MAG: hypothetical protein PHE27_05705, partial [Alphaproteobacteria bacterium]|nr:hypothetical protein [Alphaproteobacteria bacterium]